MEEQKLPDRMLAVKDVAKILNVHTNSVRRWAKMGIMPSYQYGPQRTVRFDERDIIAFLEKSKNHE